jgi:hypothetical protein
VFLQVTNVFSLFHMNIFFIFAFASCVINTILPLSGTTRIYLKAEVGQLMFKI